jgi:hypothetical protein
MMHHRVVRKMMLMFCMCSAALIAQERAKPQAIIFHEKHFSSVDTITPSELELRTLVPSGRFVSADELSAAISQSNSGVLILPYGSVFPEASWLAIKDYLNRGGNLIVLGSKPFLRPAYRDGAVWKLRPENVAYPRQLMIHDYEPTPGSDGSIFETNLEITGSELPAFQWQKAFSTTIKLSTQSISAREGSAGTIDARLDALAWGKHGVQRVSAPLIQIDHLRGAFIGGRWLFLNCIPQTGFYSTSSARKLMQALVERALLGSQEFIVTTEQPLYLESEPWKLHITGLRSHSTTQNARIELVITNESGPSIQRTLTIEKPQLEFASDVTLPTDAVKGFHTVTARLIVEGEQPYVAHSGFWIRDEQAMLAGPRIAVDKNNFTFDGKPQLVLGTTYMASDVQRLFFERPNPYVWDRDMAQIHAAGLNMLRTGWWSGWQGFTNTDGSVNEHALRTLEAYLMTAHRNGLPVQFTCFAFMPDVLGGKNAIFDPEAVARQRNMVSSLATRFKDVPFIMWDLINEPSFDNPQRMWETRPNGDEFELRAWNEWLKQRYPEAGALQAAWRSIPMKPGDVIPLPRERDFSARSAGDDGHPAAMYDFHVFMQESFASWAIKMREAIHSAGGKQPITVGQDEGGSFTRPSPSFFTPAVDFTTTHTWWLSDALLWDSLTAKQPGLPMLVQETGVQPETMLDGSSRRTPESASRLLERKLAVAMATSAGAVEWLWNTNAYMTQESEVSIGALRADTTEKPEASVMRAMANFAASAKGHMAEPQEAQIAIVMSQAMQFSPLSELAVQAQQASVRAMTVAHHGSLKVIAENQLEHLGHPKLVVVPSPQALTQAAWERLQQYAAKGGSLMVTGPFERDEQWLHVDRLQPLNITAYTIVLDSAFVQMEVQGRSVTLAYNAHAQGTLEALRFTDENTLHSSRIGKGWIHIINYPVELAQNINAAVALYRWAIQRANVAQEFEFKGNNAGVTVYANPFRDATLYLAFSETDQPREFDITDHRSGGNIHLHIGAQRAELVLLDAKSGKVLARYGPSE